MKQAIHYFIPAIGEKGSNFIEFRCGRRVHKLSERYLLTQSTEEVTCIKCKSYINNPLRVLRRYGRITVIEGFVLVLAHDFGYKYDIVVTPISPGMFNLFAGYNGSLDFFVKLEGDFSTIPEKVRYWYERNCLADVKP
jgi:hypothetical protein